MQLTAALVQLLGTLQLSIPLKKIRVIMPESVAQMPVTLTVFQIWTKDCQHVQI
jgi:hypothetical protein